jgi:chitin synthase
MIIFAGLALYMLVACVLILVKAVKGGANATLYAQIVISLIATLGKIDPCCHYSINVDRSGIMWTIGSWITSSILALDPWHLLTCMLQYL